MNASPETLIACPHCDALYSRPEVPEGERAVCDRCHTVLARPRVQAGLVVIALAVAATILLIGAVFSPFLTIRLAGITQTASIVDTALAFDGPQRVLSILVAGFILILPLTRLMLTLYVMIPLVRQTPPGRHAKQFFAWSEALRPWSMAEVFVIGCAVALVKVADLATLSFGAAFWMFFLLVIVVLIHDAWLCRWTVWQELEKS